MSPEGSSPAVDVRFSLIRWGNRRIEALFTAFLATAPTPDTRRIVEFVPFFGVRRRGWVRICRSGRRSGGGGGSVCRYLVGVF